MGIKAPGFRCRFSSFSWQLSWLECVRKLNEIQRQLVWHALKQSITLVTETVANTWSSRACPSTIFLPIVKWNETGHLPSLHAAVVNGMMNSAVMSNEIMLWQRQAGQISLRCNTISVKFTSKGNVLNNNILTTSVICDLWLNGCTEPWNLSVNPLPTRSVTSPYKILTLSNEQAIKLLKFISKGL